MIWLRNSKGDCLANIYIGRWISYDLTIFITEYYLFTLDGNCNFGQGGYTGQGPYIPCTGLQQWWVVSFFTRLRKVAGSVVRMALSVAVVDKFFVCLNWTHTLRTVLSLVNLRTNIRSGPTVFAGKQKADPCGFWSHSKVSAAISGEQSRWWLERTFFQFVKGSVQICRRPSRASAAPLIRDEMVPCVLQTWIHPKDVWVQKRHGLGDTESFKCNC